MQRDCASRTSSLINRAVYAVQEILFCCAYCTKILLRGVGLRGKKKTVLFVILLESSEVLVDVEL